MILQISGSVVKHTAHGQRVHVRQTTGDLPRNGNMFSYEENDSLKLWIPATALKILKLWWGQFFRSLNTVMTLKCSFLMGQSHWTHRSCKIRREKIRKYLFSSKVFMNWSHDVMNTDMLATICPDERLNSLEPFVSSNISALILYFTLNKRYSSTVLLYRWNIGLFTSLHLFSSCDKH